MEKRAPPQDGGPTGAFDAVHILAILLFIGTALYLRPWAMDFPLNDDWAYALAVRRLAEEGTLRLCDFGAPTLVLQIFWGALWTKALGGNLGILKLSTASLAVLGAVLFNRSLKTLGVSARSRLLAVLLLAANPFYFNLSFTFMTEVPFLCLMLLSFHLYLKAEKGGSETLLWLGSLAAGGAFLVRQTGIFLPVGYSLYLLSQRRMDLRKACLLWSIPLAALAGHGLWFHFIHGPTWASENSLFGKTLMYFSRPGGWVPETLRRLFAAALLVGAFVSPFGLGFLGDPGQFIRRKSAVAVPAAVQFALALYLFAMALFLVQNGWMPHLENMLHRAGLGVLTVGPGRLKASGFFALREFWVALTILGAAGSCLGLAALGDFWKSSQPLEKAAAHIFLAPPLVMFTLALARERFFDRYALPLLPGALLILALVADRWSWRKVPAGLGLAGLVLVSVLGTKDCLAWNEAKWVLGRLGTKKGLAAGQINNGFDWNGYWTYEKNMELLKREKPLTRIGEWEFQSLNDYRAETSFRDSMPEGSLLAEAPYRTPLSPRTERLYLWAYPEAAR